MSDDDHHTPRPSAVPPRDEADLRLLRPEGEAQPVLARTHPDDKDAEARRVRAAARWGVEPSPRARALNTIDIPIDTRTQTILFHRLSEEEQAALTGGITANKNRGRR